MRKRLEFLSARKVDSYDSTDIVGENVVICINKFPYRLTREDAQALASDLDNLLIEEITYDG